MFGCHIHTPHGITNMQLREMADTPFDTQASKLTLYYDIFYEIGHFYLGLPQGSKSNLNVNVNVWMLFSCKQLPLFDFAGQYGLHDPGERRNYYSQIRNNLKTDGNEYARGKTPLPKSLEARIVILNCLLKQGY